MTMRDQLAQRLMPGVGADGPGSDDPAAVRDLVRTTHVGGLFLGGNGLTLFTEPTLRTIRPAGPVPAAVAVDDEGGRVQQRIDGIFGNLPRARRMGTMPVAQVEALARKRGSELRSIGVTVDSRRSST